MTSLYFREQLLEDEYDNKLNFSEFNTNTYVSPMDHYKISSLGSAIGATTLPPMGAFATEADVSNGYAQAATESAAQDASTINALAITAALVAAFFLMLPMQ